MLLPPVNLKSQRSIANAIWRRFSCWIGASTVALLAFASTASAAINSVSHPQLAEILETHPSADSDTDGVLSYREYQAFLKTDLAKRAHGPLLSLLENGDLLINDFEGDSHSQMRRWGWSVEGDAFGRDFGQATRVMCRRTATHNGQYLLSSYADSDAAKGKITSPLFEIKMRYVQFQFSGGQYPHTTCVNLRIDGNAVRTTTGTNNDLFETVAFDVASFKGRKATLEIIDGDAGIWGHLNIDDIVQTEQTKASRVINTSPKIHGHVIGTVQTLQRRRVGTIAIRSDRLQVDNQGIEFSNVLQAIGKNESKQTELLSGLRMANGEVWFGKIAGFKRGKVLIHSPLFAQREVPLAQIATIQFKPGKTTGNTPGTLYRDTGEPITCRLVWIRDKDVAVNCSLGVIPVPRGSIQRLVVGSVSAPKLRTQDEVALLDGHLLKGELKIAEDHLQLTHELLGVLNFEWGAVKHFRRAVSGVTWLEQLEGKVVDRVGPVMPPPAPTSVRPGDGGYLHAIRMMPRTVTKYEFSTEPAQRVLHAVLAPVPGCKAGFSVRVRDGERLLWQQQISAESKPIEVAIDLQQASAILIEVDYGDRLAFPCGVDLRDAYMFAK